jgi:hypothetical protein
MKVHTVKSWPQFFKPILEGSRTHELRKNDRGYEIGDRLELREFMPETQTYSGRRCIVEVTSITSIQEPCAVSENALHRDFCILSVKRITSETI